MWAVWLIAKYFAYYAWDHNLWNSRVNCPLTILCADIDYNGGNVNNVANTANTINKTFEIAIYEILNKMQHLLSFSLMSTTTKSKN